MPRRVRFSASDFGAFLVHPLIAAASAEAVLGAPFRFSRETLWLCADGSTTPSATASPVAIQFSGTAAASGETFYVSMAPTATGVACRAAVDPSTPPAPGRASIPASVVAKSMENLFGNLFVDLEGAELRFERVSIARYNGSETVLDLSMGLRVREFPPLSVKF